MRHIYVHVPFCARRCTYCDFAIAVRRQVPSERYVDLVLGEYELRRAQPDWDDEPIETLYLGGGTPSMLAPNELARLVRTILDTKPPVHSAQLTAHREVTLEANPDDVTPDAAQAWVESCINRVSLGAQSFDPDVLEWMHRTHDPESIPRAMEILDGVGVATSLDLIFGRPEGHAGSIEHDLARALALEPDHVSAYGLTLEPATALAHWVERGSIIPADDDRYAAEFLVVHERLTEAGFEHYEVSNYARPGKRAVHNAAYWSGHPYLGLGPSAHSFRDGRRWWNVREWAAYERMMTEGADPTAGEEVLSPEQRKLEEVYLGLRTAEGVSASASPRLGLSALAGRGWVEERGGRIRATPEGWLRLDVLATALTTSPEGG